MKILLFTDLHMCPRASIINKWGNKYPKRLENCINSINWVEEQASLLKCDYVVNLGDFFDRPDLTSDTITACNDIHWTNIKHYSLVGNHDASISSLTFNSANRLASTVHEVVDMPSSLVLGDCIIYFLPYITETTRQPLTSYFPNIDTAKKPRIILSHNDLNGIQLGPIVSKAGFTPEEIQSHCELFINGHLHNGQTVAPKVINLGNLTGKDFGENAQKYSHNIAVLDTATLKLKFIENPFAYNFYKLNIMLKKDLSLLQTLKANSVVSVKCESSLVNEVKQGISKNPNITESRVITIREDVEDIGQTEIDLSVDHIARFIDCCKLNIDNSTILAEELSLICK